MSAMRSKNSLIFPGQVSKHQPSDVSPCLRLSLGSAQPQLTMELQKERWSQHRHCPGCGMSAHVPDRDEIGTRSGPDRDQIRARSGPDLDQIWTRSSSQTDAFVTWSWPCQLTFNKLTNSQITNFQTYKLTNLQTCKLTNLQTHKLTNLRAHTHSWDAFTNLQTYKLSNFP